ncbi:DUF3014 domain-containing protein [uncultured Umboniibacter sp.]|uniref:DUF3014 domain-containing protein n=1 Tax=uncultured Umboniibacter sp. TaxID=1798917 RepID=UPI00262EBB31|nr:DUF3014 domain-containing protein [uncultured Umboniibacter sp.]
MTEQSVTNKKPLLIFTIGVVAIAAITLFVLNEDKPAPIESTEVDKPPTLAADLPPIETPAQPEVSAEPESTLPEDLIEAEVIATKPQPVPINQSDEPFALSIAQLGPAHPVIDWLIPTQILRKMVAMVDALSRGELMFKNRPITNKVIDGAFLTENQPGRIELSSNNFARYDTVISAIEYVDEDTAIELYHFWSPRLEEAYAELGVQTSFDQALRTALERIVDAPEVAGNIELVRPSVYYKFADPRLENLSDVDKLMIRMGPANANRLKAKVQLIIEAMDANPL